MTVATAEDEEDAAEALLDLVEAEEDAAEADDDVAEALLDVVEAALPVVDPLVALIEPDIDVDVMLAAPALVELDIIVVRVPPVEAAGAEAAATPWAAAM